MRGRIKDLSNYVINPLPGPGSYNVDKIAKVTQRKTPSM